jgi:hypothetical protein
LDSTIEALDSGDLDVAMFPPLEFVERRGNLYSLSNRRLFVFRVMANRMASVELKVAAANHPFDTHLLPTRRHFATWRSYCIWAGCVCHFGDIWEPF